MADRFAAFVRRSRRFAPVEAFGLQDRAAAAIVATTAAALVLAELTLLAGGLVAGSIAWSSALLLILGLGLVRPDRPEGRLSIALAAVPVLRLASISIPAVILPVYAWHALIGGTVLLAVVLAARTLGLRPADLGLRPAAIREIAILGAGGAALGLAAYLVDDAAPLPAGIAVPDLVLLSIAVVVFGAFLEELLLRGLVQRVAAEVAGDGAVAASVALTVLLYAASLNLRYIILMGAVAIVFGVVARRSGSIAAPVAGHALLLWTQAVAWPLVLG